MHCGVIVATIREVDREYSRIHPLLMYFNTSMNRSERDELVGTLNRSGRSNEWSRRIRSSMSSLTSVQAGIRKEEIDYLTDQIVHLAAELVWGGDRNDEDEDAGKSGYHGGIDTFLEERQIDADMWDADTNYLLEEADLAGMILRADSEGDAAEIRRAMQLIVLHGTERSLGGYRAGLESSLLSPISLALTDIEDLFGQLVGQSQLLFPEIPVPAWVWAKG